MRHYTSRAGDPHRHLHLQINARVFAAGKWRGLHTVGVRDFLGAINGIGHAAVACDPEFRRRVRRARLHHGCDWRNTGARRVRRSVQRAGGADRPQYGPLRTRVDGRAPRRTPGAGAAAGLGRPRLGRGPPGQGHPAARGRPRGAVAGRAGRPRLPRPEPARRADARPRSARSTATRAVERGAGPAGRRPLGVERRRRPRRGRAADRRRRASSPTRRCASSWPRTSPPAPWPAACRCWTATGVPEHIRAWTSRPVLDVEADLAARFAARAASRPRRGRRPGRCRPGGRPGGWMPARPRRSPRWPATGRWWWWRARPARARPPRWPPPATCSSGRGGGWWWSPRR